MGTREHSRGGEALDRCAIRPALYAVNLYGFTALFPWFAQLRDWITIAAHLVFGVTAASVYRWLETRRKPEAILTPRERTVEMRRRGTGGWPLSPIPSSLSFSDFVHESNDPANKAEPTAGNPPLRAFSLSRTLRFLFLRNWRGRFAIERLSEAVRPRSPEVRLT